MIDQRLEGKRKPSTRSINGSRPSEQPTTNRSVNGNGEHAQQLHDEPEAFNRLEYDSSDSDNDSDDDSHSQDGHHGGQSQSDEDEASDVYGDLGSPRIAFQRRRRLSTFESNDGIMDLESDTIGGSARSFGTVMTIDRSRYGSIRGPRRGASGTSV